MKQIIKWETKDFDKIPRATDTAILVFVQKNKVIHLDTCYKNNIYTAIDDIIWKYGFITEYITLYIGRVLNIKDLKESQLLNIKQLLQKDTSQLLVELKNKSLAKKVYFRYTKTTCQNTKTKLTVTVIKASTLLNCKKIPKPVKLKKKTT